jgi:hypothetical protein
VFDWFANNDCAAIESSDDQGGYPNEEQLRAAFDALSYKQLELVYRPGLAAREGMPWLLTPSRAAFQQLQ